MDKRELKEAIGELPQTILKNVQFGMTEILVSLKSIDDLIDQLDEPETLSQEWIDDHLVHEDEYDFYYIDPDDLKQLIVRKSEKPVVPAFVGERIKEYKELKYGVSLAFNIDGSIDSDVRFSKWLTEMETNGDVFARAWIYGYTVEEEKKYYVKLGNLYLGNWMNTKEITFEKEKAFVYGRKFMAEDAAKIVGGEIEEVSE